MQTVEALAHIADLPPFTRQRGSPDAYPHPKHLSPGTFRVALINCFNHFGLRATFVTDADQWKKFSMFYCSIVGDCPIVFTASKLALKYVTKVELEGIQRGTKMGKWRTVPLAGWKLTLTDGSMHNWAFYMG